MKEFRLPVTGCSFCAAQVSGVIAVVVFGLYGSATAKWGLSPKVAESGIFDNFWDTIGFAITGMVFFFSGVSCVNFFVRSAGVSHHATLKPQHDTPVANISTAKKRNKRLWVSAPCVRHQTQSLLCVDFCVVTISTHFTALLWLVAYLPCTCCCHEVCLCLC